MGAGAYMLLNFAKEAPAAVPVSVVATPPAVKAPAPTGSAPAKTAPKREAAPKPDVPPPPTAPEAAPTTATLHIDSDVPAAQVFIDHAFVGTTPVTARNILPGPHRLNVS